MNRIFITFLLLFSTQSFALCPLLQTGQVRNPNLIENSGIDFSNVHDDVIWSLNDSRHAPRLYALKSDGTDLGEFSVEGATNTDWEDIEIGQCLHNPKIDCIYAADIGNNKRKRDSLSIYVIEEPRELRGQTLRVAQIITFKSPDKNFESLSLNEKTGEFYLFSKIKRSSTKWTPDLYKLSPADKVLTKVTELDFKKIPGLKVEDAMITASDFDSVSETFLVGTYGKAFEISLHDLVMEKAKVIEVPSMKKAEAIAYGPGGSVFTTSEGLHMPIYRLQCR